MRLITMKTAECEGVEEAGALLASASLARVLSVEPIGDSHNRKAIVDTERYGRKTVVCGAPTAARVWNRLRSDWRQDDCRRRKRRHARQRRGAGHQQRSRRHRRARPPRLDTRLLPDAIIEVDNKSLTHRPDLWGHFGMAREVAAIVHRPLRDPVDLSLLPSGPAPISAEIADLALCPRYSALVFENVTVRSFAALAAVPAAGDRAEPDQQHRGRDQLCDGGTGPAHACLRRGPSAGARHLTFAPRGTAKASWR